MFQTHQLHAIRGHQAFGCGLEQHSSALAVRRVQSAVPAALTGALTAALLIEVVEAVRHRDQIVPAHAARRTTDALQIELRWRRRCHLHRLNPGLELNALTAHDRGKPGVVEGGLWPAPNGQWDRERTYRIADVLRHDLSPGPLDVELLVDGEPHRGLGERCHVAPDAVASWSFITGAATIARLFVVAPEARLAAARPLYGLATVRLAVRVHHQPQFPQAPGRDARQAHVANGLGHVGRQRLEDGVEARHERRNVAKVCLPQQFRRDDAKVVEGVWALVGGQGFTHGSVP